MVTVVFTLQSSNAADVVQVEERRAANTVDIASIVKCSSKMAPRLRAEGDGGMLLSPIIISLMLERGTTAGLRNSIERVFPSFNFS